MLIPDYASVLAGGIVWVMLTLIVYQSIGPYVHAEDNILMIVSHHELLATLVIGMLVKGQVAIQEGWDLGILSMALMLTKVMVIFLGLYFTISERSPMKIKGSKVKPGATPMMRSIRRVVSLQVQHQEKEMAARLELPKLRHVVGFARLNLLSEKAGVKNLSGREELKKRSKEELDRLAKDLELERQRQTDKLRERLALRRKTKVRCTGV